MRAQRDAALERCVIACPIAFFCDTRTADVTAHHPHTPMQRHPTRRYVQEAARREHMNARMNAPAAARPAAAAAEAKSGGGGGNEEDDGEEKKASAPAKKKVARQTTAAA